MEESIFYKHISKDANKLEILKKGLKQGTIQSFDVETLTKLRRIYYSFFSGIIYLYGEPTDFSTIGNKLEILSHIFKNEDYQIVHGDTNSTREIIFFEYGSQHLDYNSWMEVKRGNKIYVYDVFSMLRFEKEIYYQLENPQVNRIVPKKVIESHPSRIGDDYSKPRDCWMLVGYIPKLETKLKNHPYKDLLLPELTRYKKQVNYDDILLEWKEEEREIYGKKA